MMKYYCAYALVIASSIELPLITLEKTSTQPDVLLTVGKLPSSKNKKLVLSHKIDGFQKTEIYSSSENDFETYVYRDSRYNIYIKDGREIIFDLDVLSNLDTEQLGFFLHVGLSTVLYNRKYLSLHGSAIEYNGKAYIFLGDSGSGKSTTASSFLQKGCKFISDDICVVFQKDNIPYVVPSTNHMKVTKTVFHDSSFLQSFFESYAEMEEGKYLCRINKSALSLKPVPIAGIFNIQIVDNKTTLFENVNGIKKIEVLTQNPARPIGLKIYNLFSDFYRDCFHLSAKVSITKVFRKKDEFIVNELIALIVSNN